MRSLVLQTPSTLDEALNLRAEYGSDSMLLAGGQSLLILLRQGLVLPEPLISIDGVAELRYVRSDGAEIRMGATTTYASLASHPVVRAVVPMLGVAAGSVGSVHIRNRGTVGGSLGHADPAGDVPVALLALEADVVIASRSGERLVPVAELFTGGLFETVVEGTEMITEVRVEKPDVAMAYGYRRFSYREGEYPQCQAAVRLDWSEGRCARAWVAVGGAGACPQRLAALEESFAGTGLDPGQVDEALDAVLPSISPLADVRGSTDWKRQVVRHVIVGAVQDAKADAGG